MVYISWHEIKRNNKRKGSVSAPTRVGTANSNSLTDAARNCKQQDRGHIDHLLKH